MIPIEFADIHRVHTTLRGNLQAAIDYLKLLPPVRPTRDLIAQLEAALEETPARVFHPGGLTPTWEKKRIALTGKTAMRFFVGLPTDNATHPVLQVELDEAATKRGAAWTALCAKDMQDLIDLLEALKPAALAAEKEDENHRSQRRSGLAALGNASHYPSQDEK